MLSEISSLNLLQDKCINLKKKRKLENISMGIPGVVYVKPVQRSVRMNGPGTYFKINKKNWNIFFKGLHFIFHW